MIREVKTLTIGGQKWKVKWVNELTDTETGEKVWGLCYAADKTIVISREQPAAEVPGTVIHEVTHGLFPCLSEEAVTDLEGAVVAALTRIGVLKKGDTSVRLKRTKRAIDVLAVAGKTQGGESPAAGPRPAYQRQPLGSS